MNTQEYWNKSLSTIPEDKDPSAYAIDREKSFPRESVVCDLGGGDGADSMYFMSQGHSVKLVDISDMALSKAKNTSLRTDIASKLQTYQADLSKGFIPLDGESCDIVYSRLVLHYFESAILRQLFKEIYRILKRGGTAFITAKSPDDSAEMAYLNQKAIEIESGVFSESGHIKTRFSAKQFVEILADSGLPAQAYSVKPYTEKIGGRNDSVKSGNSRFILNEITIRKGGD